MPMTWNTIAVKIVHALMYLTYQTWSRIIYTSSKSGNISLLDVGNLLSSKHFIL